MKNKSRIFILLMGITTLAFAQAENFTAVRAGVDFSDKVRVRDGSGFNYVQSAPPGFMTKQKADRGRDLDPAFKNELAMYMINWIIFLKEEEKLPVKYLSVNNEGEDWHKWTSDGLS